MKRGLFWRVYLHGILLLSVVGLFITIAGVVVGHRVRSGQPIPHVVHFVLLHAAVLLVLAVGSIPLVRAMTRPLERLTRAVERFGRLDPVINCAGDNTRNR